MSFTSSVVYTITALKLTIFLRDTIYIEKSCTDYSSMEDRARHIANRSSRYTLQNFILRNFEIAGDKNIDKFAKQLVHDNDKINNRIYDVEELMILFEMIAEINDKFAYTIKTILDGF